MSTNSSCLNCSQPVAGKYCGTCGQKASTHRISIRHFVAHDVLHGIWHLERSMLFTLKEVFVHPGHMARNYVNGQRVRYYNFYTLLIWVFAANLFVSHQIEKFAPAQYHAVDEEKLVQVIDNNGKLFMLALLPVMAFCTFGVFRRLKLNYTEHLIPATVVMTGCICIDMVSNVADWAFGTDNLLVIAVILAYWVFVYYQFCNKQYTFWGFAWRITLTFLVFCALIVLFVVIGNQLVK